MQQAVGYRYNHVSLKTFTIVIMFSYKFSIILVFRIWTKNSLMLRDLFKRSIKKNNQSMIGSKVEAKTNSMMISILTIMFHHLACTPSCLNFVGKMLWGDGPHLHPCPTKQTRSVLVGRMRGVFSPSPTCYCRHIIYSTKFTCKPVWDT